MNKAKLNICLICLAGIVVAGAEPNGVGAAAIWQNNRDYTFMWWAYGLRDPSKVFHIQTSRYGLSFDFDDFELKTFGPIANAACEEEVLLQDNNIIESLDRAGLRCVVEHDGYRYEATEAGPDWTDCMLVDSGKFFQQAKGVLADARLSIVDQPRVYTDTHSMARSPCLSQIGSPPLPR